MTTDSTDLTAALHYEQSRADAAEAMVRILRKRLDTALKIATSYESALKTRSGIQLLLDESGLSFAEVIQIYHLPEPTQDQKDN